jgi:hypothetical protein
VEHKEVRDSRTLRRVSRAAEATALIYNVPLGGESAVAMQLSELATKLLIISYDVKHACAHWRA